MTKNRLLLILPILIFLLMIAIIVIIVVDNDQSDPRIENSAGIQCVQGGCSGQLCVEKGSDAISTCEWMDEYQCFNQALCEVQDDGKCGWTLTPEYEACMEFIKENYN